MYKTIASNIREFVAENFNYRGAADSLAESDSLMESGLVDSIGILELVTFLESEYHIKITDAEILPENLDTIGSIASFVQHKSTLVKVA